LDARGTIRVESPPPLARPTHQIVKMENL
jgi:hypothetical protein